MTLPALPGSDVQVKVDTVPATLSITWESITDAFLGNYRGATRRTYKDAWGMFLTFCSIDTQTLVTAVPDEDTVQVYRDSLLDSGRSPNTINAYLAAVRAFYRFLHRYVRKSLRTGRLSAERAGELQLLIEGVLDVGKVRVSNSPGRLPTTIEQSRELIASIPTDTTTDLRDRAMIALIIGCGLRRIEVARANRGDLVHRSGQQLLRIQQKGHQAKDAWVVIWPGVERLLRPWLADHPSSEPDAPLFPSLSRRDYGTDLTPRSISRIVRNRLDAIGLTDYSTHSLRHAFATIALTSDDVDIRDVQHALGHNSVTTTERYAHQAGRLNGLPEKAVNDIVFAKLDGDNK